MSESAGPSIPPPPPPGRSRLRWEVAAVSLVLLTAAGFGLVAYLTGSSNGTPVADNGPGGSGGTGTSPTSSPSGTTSPPSSTTSPEESEPVAEPVSFRRVEANLAPSGCEGDLTFAWIPDRGDESLVGEEAVIRVTGPQVAGTYRETFTPDGLSLEFHVVLGEPSRWTAVARLVGGRPADPNFFVEASIDSLPFC